MTTVPTLEREDVQGNILSPYRMDHAQYLLLSVADESSSRGLLSRLLPQITGMTRRPGEHHGGVATNVAVTYAGFERLGLRRSIMAGFPTVFRQTTRQRADLLGDTAESSPSLWPEGVGTGAVHFLVSLHGHDLTVLDHQVSLVEQLARECGADLIESTSASLVDGNREHFGFADGAGQPDVEGVRPRHPSRQGGGVPLRNGSWRQVKLGEFILGYPDEDGATTTDPHPGLTRNGSYMVYRKLAQNVSEFRSYLADMAATAGLPQELLAAKLVGRWRDGKPVADLPERSLTTDLTTVQDRQPSNDFRYLPHDSEGLRCPVGSHIRRANPRDSLNFAGIVADGGVLSRRHRIIRRGMPYGPAYPVDGEVTGDSDRKTTVERGLVFVCYNADISRQFETIQIEWCNNGNAFGLGSSPDFLFTTAGSGRTMTIPRVDAPPLLLPLPQTPLVTTRAAEYLFTPGFAALHKLSIGAFC